MKFSIYSEVFTFNYALWSRKQAGLQVVKSFWCNARQLTPLSFLFSTILQTRWCASASHAWWDCPPALLSLARGDICGGRSNCGPDHLCQEPGSQGRSHEEAQVLLEGCRLVESKAQKLHPSAHIYLQSVFPTQEMEGAMRGLWEAPPSMAAATGTTGRLRTS